jgi:hypothetical protein
MSIGAIKYDLLKVLQDESWHKKMLCNIELRKPHYDYKRQGSSFHFYENDHWQVSLGANMSINSTYADAEISRLTTTNTLGRRCNIYPPSSDIT